MSRLPERGRSGKVGIMPSEKHAKWNPIEYPWHSPLPDNPQSPEARFEDHGPDAVLAKLSDRYPVRVLTRKDLPNIYHWLRSPAYRGRTLLNAPYHYGFAYSFLIQAARYNPRNYLVHYGKGRDRGFFLITTKNPGKTPFVILSPVGNIGKHVANFAQELADISKDNVIVKKAHPALFKELVSLGGGDYRKDEEGYEYRAPHGDDSYSGPVVLTSDVMNPPDDAIRWEINRRLKEFGHALQRKLTGYRLEVEQYDPRKHQIDVESMLHTWAPEFAVRYYMEKHKDKDGNPQKGTPKEYKAIADAAIEDHMAFLNMTPDFQDIHAYMGYLVKRNSSNEAEARIPLGYVSFEKTGFLTRNSAREIIKSIGRTKFTSKRRSHQTLWHYITNPKTDRAGATRSIRRRVESCYTMPACPVITDLIRQGPFALEYEAIKRLHGEGSNQTPASLLNLTGSEHEKLFKFKMAFGPIYKHPSKQIVFHPKES